MAIRDAQAGERPEADHINEIRDAAERKGSGGTGVRDEFGFTPRPDGEQTPLRWGKLDGTLTAGGTQVVSLWRETGGGWAGWDEDSGENWTCYAPFLLSSGSIASGKRVLVGIVNGRKVVLLPEC